MHFVSVATVAAVCMLYMSSGESAGAGSADGDSDKERSVSTSVASMVSLLELEGSLIQNLADYADELEKKLNIVRGALPGMQLENSKFRQSPEKYLSNPLNSFSLVRRMHEDWISWELFMAEPVGTEQIKQLQNYRPDMPTSTDLTEAVSGMLRLQTTYRLNPLDMVNGLIQGKQFDERLSALDSFTIGRELLKADQTYHAGFWLYSALQIFKENQLPASFNFRKLQILELYAEALLKQNRVQDALNVIKRALAEHPHSAKLLKRAAEIELLLKTGNLEPKQPPPVRDEVYERGCRGEFQAAPSKLHCRYNTTTSAFLKLAPLKMEEVHLDPYMVLFHDVMSDKEIAELQEMASPSLKRATVYDEGKKRSVVIDRRTSKFAWFPNKKSNMTVRLNQRIADMTGFELEGSEMLQVMNYGLGGHYSTHFDYFALPPTADVVRVQGDRISTVLFYMSDVELGGATVFPNIRKAVFPRKGSAVVWYNLNNKGEGNQMTLHAACPVIVGSKWVCNKWIRERNQVFRKPCYPE